MFEVQHYASFACVGMQENMAHTGVGHGTNMAHIVSLWGLQFDHFSAQLGQNLSRKRPHDHRSQIENFDPCERAFDWGRIFNAHAHSGVIPACLIRVPH